MLFHDVWTDYQSMRSGVAILSLSLALLASQNMHAAMAAVTRFNAGCMQVRFYVGAAVNAEDNLDLALQSHEESLAQKEAGWAWHDMMSASSYLDACDDPRATAAYDRELIRLCTDLRNIGFLPAERANKLIRKAQDDLKIQSST